mmetsp:Transcript_361/g.1535  ORF Transcript_361/g.1535 Transcript_361/m.1535 type:complete len:328 (-) Transcript_361:37-1020(-)
MLDDCRSDDWASRLAELPETEDWVGHFLEWLCHPHITSQNPARQRMPGDEQGDAQKHDEDDPVNINGLVREHNKSSYASYRVRLSWQSFTFGSQTRLGLDTALIAHGCLMRLIKVATHRLDAGMDLETAMLAFAFPIIPFVITYRVYLRKGVQKSFPATFDLARALEHRRIAQQLLASKGSDDAMRKAIGQARTDLDKTRAAHGHKVAGLAAAELRMRLERAKAKAAAAVLALEDLKAMPPRRRLYDKQPPAEMHRPRDGPPVAAVFGGGAPSCPMPWFEEQCQQLGIPSDERAHYLQQMSRDLNTKDSLHAGLNELWERRLGTTLD